MEKIWLKKYDPGVPRTINPDQFSSLVELLDENFKIFAKEKAYISYGSTLTYKEIDYYSRALSGFLKYKCNLIKGDRVAIILPNILQYPISMAAILRSGLTVVNIHIMHTPEAKKIILNDAGVKCVIAWGNATENLEKIIDDTKVENVILTNSNDMVGNIEKFKINTFLSYFKKNVARLKVKQAKVFEFGRALTFWNRMHFHKIPIDPSDIAFIQYKETELNHFKGVVLTHRNIQANSQQITAWTDSFFKRKFRGVTIPAPLSFILSSITGFFIFSRFGGTHILLEDPRDIDNFINEVTLHPFSTIVAYNAFFKRILESEAFRKLDFSKIKYVFSGGGPLQESVVDQWKQVTQSILLNSYGLAEACALVAVDPLTKKWFDGSVGLPLPSTDIKICDPNGKELPTGERGELWVHGPQVMKEYWNKPEETKKVLTEDGWLKTGDAGSIDQDGYLHIYDRLVDVISIGEHKIYPSEIEEIILEMDGVKEVAVVGIKENDMAVKILACIVKKKEEITEKDIIQYCKKYMQPERVPNKIRFIDKVPRTFSGRLLRGELKRMGE